MGMQENSLSHTQVRKQRYSGDLVEWISTLVLTVAAVLIFSLFWFDSIISKNCSHNF
jgi:hypothetical protein